MLFYCAISTIIHTYNEHRTGVILLIPILGGSVRTVSYTNDRCVRVRLEPTADLGLE